MPSNRRRYAFKAKYNYTILLQTLIIDGGILHLNVKCKTEICITFHLNFASRSSFIYCNRRVTRLQPRTHSPSVCPLCFVKQSCHFKCRSADEEPQCLCVCVHAFVCMCIYKKHTNWHKHTLVPHSFTLAACLTQRASISRCAFFSLQGELKRRWGLLCLSPSDEFMHLKRSFVARELALHACTLSGLPDGLYII